MKDSIIFLAKGLTLSEGRPGVLALALFMVAFICGVIYYRKTREQVSAIKGLHHRLQKYESAQAFAEKFDSEFRPLLNQHFKQSRDKSKKSIYRAWDEFRETLCYDEQDNCVVLRNAVRPTQFLNIEDLGFGPGFYRILPNLFVSCGLFLTFLGLIAALNQFSDSMSQASNMDQAMRDFMKIASAKFIMSLAGLFCSIFFTVLLRTRGGTLSNALARLCTTLKDRLTFISLEDIGLRQLKAATEQRDNLRDIAMGMVDELKQSLHDSAQETVSAVNASAEKTAWAMTTSVRPILAQVEKSGANHMESLASELSSQLSHSVGNALTKASQSLDDAAERISDMIDKMSANNTQAGENLESALTQVSQAVSNLHAEITTSGRTASETMANGADNLLSTMNEALTTMRDNMTVGAETVRQQMIESSTESSTLITGAGQSLSDSVKKASDSIARLGSEVIGDQLIPRLETIGTQLGKMSDGINQGVSGAQKAAEELKNGASVFRDVSEQFKDAGQSLTSATEPIRNSHQAIETTLSHLHKTVETVSENLKENSASVAQSAAHVLETAQTSLGTEREGIRSTLETAKVEMARLSREIEQLAKIDQMLTQTMEKYKTELRQSIDLSQDHVRKMSDELAPALDTLRSVVEQAENFQPLQKREDSKEQEYP